MAGKLTLNPVQINDSATATNNFVLKTDNLGGLKLSRGNDGATSQDILEVDTNGVVMMTQGSGRMVLGTAQATTSGTSIDFTGIPSWVKRITVMLNGVSTNGTSSLRVQIGGGSVEVTGYDSTGSTMGVGNATTTAGFDNFNAAAADVRTQYCVLVLMGANKWLYAAQSTPAGSGNPGWVTGTKTTSATLDRIRLTTVNGTDTFDAGSVNILMEG